MLTTFLTFSASYASSVDMPGMDLIEMHETPNLLDLVERFSGDEILREGLMKKSPKFRSVVENHEHITDTPMELVVEIFLDILKTGEIIDRSISPLLERFANVVETLQLPEFTPSRQLSGGDLIVKAYWGEESIQSMLVHSNATDFAKLVEFARLGWADAQNLIVAKCIKEGKISEVFQYADMKWEAAQEWVIQTYLKEENFQRISYLAHNKNWAAAQRVIVSKLVNKENTLRLLDLAYKGWVPAQDIVSEGYAEGGNGFKQDDNMVFHLAKRGYLNAQSYVVSRYQESKTGSSTNLFMLARLGWQDARRQCINGLSDGDYGFIKNPVLAEILHMCWVKK